MRRACWLFAMPVTGVAVTPLTSTAIAKSFHGYRYDIAASIGIEVAPLDGGTERSPPRVDLLYRSHPIPGSDPIRNV